MSPCCSKELGRSVAIVIIMLMVIIINILIIIKSNQTRSAKEQFLRQGPGSLAMDKEEVAVIEMLLQVRGGLIK